MSKDNSIFVKVLKKEGTSDADVLKAVREMPGVEHAVEYEPSASVDALWEALREVGEKLWRIEGPGDRRIEELRRLVEDAIAVDFRNIPRSQADVGVR